MQSMPAVTIELTTSMNQFSFVTKSLRNVTDALEGPVIGLLSHENVFLVLFWLSFVLSGIIFLHE
jgi:hypothetical protein